MSQENQITLRGYLTADPKLYQKTSEAVPLTELRVGCTPRRINKATGEWQDLPTSYYKVKCWRRLAINAVSSLHKGDQVLIRGRFYMNNWIDNQQRPRSAIEIEADTLGHDLTYGWSHFLHGTRQAGNSAAVNSGEVARQQTEGTEGSGPADRDGENLPDREADGPGEPEVAVPPPGDEEDGEQDADGRGRPGLTGVSGFPDFPGDSQADAGDERGALKAHPTEAAADGQTADGSDPGPAPGVTSDASPLEREPVTF
ncbi:MAG: single-stranded DNA-binding protein [Trebonia sp.]